MHRDLISVALALFALVPFSWAGGSIGWQTAAGGSQCVLGSLTLRVGAGVLPLSPSFAPNVRIYSAILDYASPPPQVEMVALDGCSARRVDGSSSIAPGDQGEVRVEVSTASEVASTYIVTVVRRAGLEDGLWSLGVNGTWWSPVFETNALAYASVVPPISAESVMLSYSKIDSGQSVEVVIGDYTVFTAAADRARALLTETTTDTTTASVSTVPPTMHTVSSTAVTRSIDSTVPATTVAVTSLVGASVILTTLPNSAVATSGATSLFGIETNTRTSTVLTPTGKLTPNSHFVVAAFTSTTTTSASATMTLTTTSTTSVTVATSTVLLSGALSYSDLLAAGPQPPLEPLHHSSPGPARALDIAGTQMATGSPNTLLDHSSSLVLGHLLPNASLVLPGGGLPVLVPLPATITLRVWPAAVSAVAGQPPSYRWPAPFRIYTVVLSKAPLESLAPQGLPQPFRTAWAAMRLELHKHPIVVPPEHKMPLAVFGTLSVATVLCLFPLCAACPCLGGAGD